MSQGDDLAALPTGVLDAVARVVGTEVVPVARLSGGLNGGAIRVRLGDGGAAVLKVVPLTRATQLDETLRAQRVVGHVRGRGYPTPAWLGVGATAGHVWHLTELVDAAPVARLTPALVEQLMEVVELQAGAASEPYDHWTYAWRVATGREPAVAGLDRYSSAVADVAGRARRLGADLPAPQGAPDMVHADLNPSNVLVRDGVVVALVDIENAGSGTRATDLTTLLWHTFDDTLDEVRSRLWTRILSVVGWEGAAMLTVTQVLLQLEWPLRLERDDLVPGAVSRGRRALDELEALR